eukprot:3952180-Pleurochrysis_carterae.AAC.1
MEIRADVGEHGLDSVMLIAKLDVNTAMSAPVTQEDTAVALIAGEVRFRGASTSAQSGVGFGNAYDAARFQCGGEERFPMREFDDLCRRIAERHLSKYVSSTRSNSCVSFPGFAEAHKVTEAFIRLIAAIRRYIEPEYFAADQYGSSCYVPKRALALP